MENTKSKQLLEDLDWRRVAAYCNVSIGKGYVARWEFGEQKRSMDIKNMFNKLHTEQLIGLAAAICYVAEDKMDEHSTD